MNRKKFMLGAYSAHASALSSDSPRVVISSIHTRVWFKIHLVSKLNRAAVVEVTFWLLNEAEKPTDVNKFAYRVCLKIVAIESVNTVNPKALLKFNHP